MCQKLLTSIEFLFSNYTDFLTHKTHTKNRTAELRFLCCARDHRHHLAIDSRRRRGQIKMNISLALVQWRQLIKETIMAAI